MASRGTALWIAALVGLVPISVTAQDHAFFEKRVRPILANRCFACHGPHAGEGQAGLRLDSMAGILKGGRSGPAVVPGSAAQSLLIHAINHDTLLQMPPKSKLPLGEVAVLTEWVDTGAHWPEHEPAPAPEAIARSDGFSAEERSHWAFQPLKAPAMPPGESAVDALLGIGQSRAGLRPVAASDKRALIRRATLDLHGLLPTPDEVRRFLADTSDDAFARVLDRLLASPRYGERWGRHWLDVARYSDSNGMDDNIVHGDAWRYRDYVIRAFNQDKPYDEFVREQLAGDILTDWSDANRAEGLVATGFLMLGPKMVGEDDPVKQKLDFADEQLATTARAFMALSIDCARCHDHKFDPIRSADYYSMLGIFTSTKTVLTYRVTSKLNATALASAEENRRLSEIEKRFDYHSDFVTNYNQATTPKQVVEAQRAAEDDALAEYYSIPKAMAVAEGDAADLPLMINGNHLTPGPIAPRRFPAILAGEQQGPIASQGSGRLELAQWLTSKDHPLTARVMVNRIWKWHFGEGIVQTPDNFGKLGEPPDHPELLDWLALQFQASGWSVKSMHRRIMLSDAYQRSSRRTEGHAEADPDNRQFSHANRRRMEAETLRDALLAVSDRLDLATGGKTIPHKNFVNLNAQSRSRDPALYDSRRRSVYLPVLRSALYEMFAAFDFANPSTSNGARGATMVAPQALFMLNSDSVDEASAGFAARLARQIPGSDAERIVLAHEIAFSRPSERDETESWGAFLDRYEAATGNRDAAWKAMCRILIASNEFLYIQ